MNLHHTLAVVIISGCIARHSYSASTIVETFENYKPATNIIQHPDLGYFFVPGNVSEFTFHSGLVLIAPVPNPGSRLGGFPEMQGVVLGDWAWNGPGPTGAPFCFGFDCLASSSQVPSGTAYLAYDGTAQRGSVQFRLPVPAFSIQALFTGQTDITLTAYDSVGNQVSVVTVEPVAADAWRSNLITAQSSSGITRVEFSGDFFLLDDIAFTQIPEPNVGALFACLGMATLFRRRRNRIILRIA